MLEGDSDDSNVRGEDSAACGPITMEEHSLDFEYELYKFVGNREVVTRYVGLLANFDAVPPPAVHCALKLISRLIRQCKLEAMLFQLSVMHVILQILDDPFARHPRHSDLYAACRFIARRFFAVAARNEALFIELLVWKRANECEQVVSEPPYAMRTSKKKPSHVALPVVHDEQHHFVEAGMQETEEALAQDGCVTATLSGMSSEGREGTCTHPCCTEDAMHTSFQAEAAGAAVPRETTYGRVRTAGHHDGSAFHDCSEPPSLPPSLPPSDDEDVTAMPGEGVMAATKDKSVKHDARGVRSMSATMMEVDATSDATLANNMNASLCQPRSLAATPLVTMTSASQPPAKRRQIACNDSDAE